MRSSRKYIDESYLKIFPTEPHISQTTTREIVVKPIDVTTPYQKQLNRNQKYYEDNKEKVSQQQKKYKDSLSKIDKSRAKVLYYLNSDPDYHLKMKQATKEKYGFKIENGRWV